MSDYNKKQHASSVILIWDSEGALPIGDWTSLLWRSYDSGGRGDVFSIPRLIEDNASHLRARYLAWIYELGETMVRGKRLIEHLELRSGFSYWWMTLFAEKCNYSKSKQIDDVIRLMAFEKWATSRSISHVVLVSANQPLSECVRLWCEKLGIVFEWQRKEKERGRLSWLIRVYQAAPHTFQALVWLIRYVVNRYPLRGVGLKEWQQSDGRVTFFSYLFNLVPDAAKQGNYESRYWGHLPDALKCELSKTNYLHLYVKDALLPTSKHAAAIIRNFNNNGQGMQNHVTLDSFLSFLIVFRTLCDWCRVFWMGIVLKHQIGFNLNPALNLRPLFEDDWRQSLFGTVAMSNLLYFNLFQSALKSLPQQQCGVYLQENQGWEFGLIQAWRAAGHGRLIGTPHSTVRFWDLRYFFDPRSYYSSGSFNLPHPNQVACNGPAMYDAYKHGGYPVCDLVEVEALRYLHLAGFTKHARSVNALAQLPVKGAMRVLVLGDYLHSNTKLQMNLLEQSVSFLPSNTVFIVKPHPACPILSADYPVIKMSVTMEPISKLLGECDVAYSSAVTSAAVDAYCAGVPLVSVLDPNTLNLSPLRGCSGALFASTSDELVTALKSSVLLSRSQSDRQEFFTLDTKLPLWLKLLSNQAD
jgi:surface carbohydrate biosynthesis protein (TIGR04326 family)